VKGAVVATFSNNNHCNYNNSMPINYSMQQ